MTAQEWWWWYELQIPQQMKDSQSLFQHLAEAKQKEALENGN